MKYLAIIFSIYIILLSLIPCQDKEDIAVNIGSISSFHNDHTAKERSGQEVCPPFCTCTCCSTARHLVTKPVLGLFFKVVDRQYPDSKIPAVQEQSMAIWQPPQSA
jgi:hypothetical protein